MRADFDGLFGTCQAHRLAQHAFLERTTEISVLFLSEEACINQLKFWF
jgi:hypothetical protein